MSGKTLAEFFAIDEERKALRERLRAAFDRAGVPIGELPSATSFNEAIYLAEVSFARELRKAADQLFNDYVNESSGYRTGARVWLDAWDKKSPEAREECAIMMRRARAHQ